MEILVEFCLMGCSWKPNCWCLMEILVECLMEILGCLRQNCWCLMEILVEILVFNGDFGGLLSFNGVFGLVA